MSDDDDTVPATASQVAVALKDGDIDALVELAETLQEKTGDREFVESMIVLIYELLPMPAQEKILADGAKASDNIVDLFTRKQLFGIVVNSLNTKFARESLRFGARAIVKRDALGAFQLSPTAELIARPKSRSENGEPQRFHLRIGFQLARLPSIAI